MADPDPIIFLIENPNPGSMSGQKICTNKFVLNENEKSEIAHFQIHITVVWFNLIASVFCVCIVTVNQIRILADP